MTTSAESKWSGTSEKFYFLTPPSVSLRSPPTPLSGGGQETWRRGAINSNLASPRSRGEGDHEVVEGVAVGHYDKNLSVKFYSVGEFFQKQ